MPKVKAIGLSGFAGSGKTAVANYLEREYGCERRHIAEPLRAMLRSLLKSFGLDDNTIWAHLEGPLKEDLIPELGVTSRQAQISLGTEWGRELIKDSLWVDAWKVAVMGNPKIVINDSVRFPNEAQAIDDLGGFTVRITRPGVGPAKFTSSFGRSMFGRFGFMNGVHPSERIDRISCDHEIANDGDLDDLFDKVDDIMEWERVRRVVKVTPPAVNPVPLGMAA